MAQRAYMDGPFGQLHYVSEGDGLPIVLLHQMVQSSVQFAPAMPYLANHGLRPIAVDLPGFGMSDGPESPPTAQVYASIVPSLLDHLGLASVILCGHHTGASISTACAHLYPDRVSKLILHGAPFFNAEERAERLTRSHGFQPVVADGSHFQQVWNDVTRYGANKASSNATHASVLAHFLAGERQWFGHNAAYLYDMAPALAALRMPVCVISNSGDMVHPFDKRVIELRPDFVYRQMQDSGTYQSVYDQPQAWAKLVAEFANAV